MNLELLDPFRNSFPEVIEETLRLEDGGYIRTCAFNRRGTLLATGCLDGRIVIWDFDTRGTTKVLSGHNMAISSTSWSKNGYKLLSASFDKTVKLFDVMSGKVENTIQFDNAVISAQFHPRNNKFCIVCAHQEPPVFVDLETNEKKQLPEPEIDEEVLGKETKKASKQANDSIAVFNKTGSRIFTGNFRGVISVIETDTLKILYFFRVPGCAPIKQIAFSRAGKQFLVNSTDRIIRLYEGEDSRSVAREFQDPVNKQQWKQCCFSCDSDFIIGGSAEKSEHKIFIWNREEGQLIKTLDGPKEGLNDLVWHPTRPIITSISAMYGQVYVWASNYTENWSAFAPDFKELEENEEYLEREDEFDIIEEDHTAKKRKYEEDQDVDILTIDKTSYWSSDSEDDLLFIPIDIPPDPNLQQENNNNKNNS